MSTSLLQPSFYGKRATGHNNTVTEGSANISSVITKTAPKLKNGANANGSASSPLLRVATIQMSPPVAAQKVDTVHPTGPSSAPSAMLYFTSPRPSRERERTRTPPRMTAAQIAPEATNSHPAGVTISRYVAQTIPEAATSTSGMRSSRMSIIEAGIATAASSHKPILSHSLVS